MIRTRPRESRSRVAVFLLGLLLVLSPSGVARAASEDIRVGINPDDFPPYEVLDPLGRARGADFDLLRLIAEREGLSLRVVATPSFGGALDMLAAGEIDMLGALAKTPERAARFLYTAPYDESPVAIFGRTDLAPVLRLDELSGRRVALPKGYAQAAAVLARVPDILAVEVANNGEAIRALQRGDADYAVGNFITTRHLIIAEDLDAVRLMAPTDIGTGRLHFAVSPQRPDVQAALDRGIAAFADRWPDILADNLGRRHWIDPTEAALVGVVLLGAAAAVVLWRRRGRWRGSGRRRAIRLRLTGAIVALGLTLLASLAGFYHAAYQGQTTVARSYQGDIVPLRAIEQVSQAFTASLADMALRVAGGVVDLETAGELFEEVLRSQRAGWANYLASIEDPRELTLANEAERQRQRAQALVIEALGLTSAGRQAELESLLRSRLFAVTDPLSRALDRVTAYNIDRVDRTFRFLDRRFDLLSTVQTALFAVAAAVVAFVLAIGIRDVLMPLARLTGTVGRLSAGLLDRPVTGVERKDEMGALAVALETFRLSAIEMERLRLEEQTQRLAAEQAQAESRRYSELIRNITDNAPAALFEAHVDPDSFVPDVGYRARFAFVGRAVERVLGVPAEDIMADPAARMRNVHPEDVGRLTTAVRGSIADETTYHAEFRVLVDGEERWVLSRGDSRRGTDGGVVILGSYIDITEQKAQERRLADVTALAEASRKRLLDLSDALPGAIFQIRATPEGERRFLFISRRAETLLGVSLPELRADYTVWRRNVFPADLAGFLANLHRTEATGATELLVFEFRVGLPDGERWIRSDALPSRAADGAILWNGYWQDVTELKTAEAALMEEKQRTEAALTELQNTQAQLVQAEKMAALAGLVAGVAHEINTPVGIAYTAVSTLSDEVRRVQAIVEDKTAKRSDITRFLALAAETSALIETHCRNAADLIQSFKKVAVDQSHDERRVFPLAPYLDETVFSLSPQYRKGGHRVVVDCPPDIELDGFPGAISQILTNLIVNSTVHAFPDGKAGTLTLTVRRLDDERIEMRYGDDGCGVPPENRARLFEPFFTTRRGQGGSGLGLHIVHNLVVAKLGGQVWYEERPGGGAAFVLEFPTTAERLPSKTADADGGGHGAG